MSIKSISDFDVINSSLPLDIKTPDAILIKEDYELVTKLFTISSKYIDPSSYGDIPVTEIQSDCIALQAGLVECGRRFGILIAYADSIEEQLKIARAKIRIQSKNLKSQFQSEGHSINVTLDDLKDLSYTKTEAIWKSLEDARVAAEFVKFVYFAIRDQVAILDKALHRIHRIG